MATVSSFTSQGVSQLKGIQVLELASVLAGPAVGQFFAELGATVIKVENKKLGGDVTRSWRSAGEKTDDRSAYFCSVNWGKQSIAIDLTRHEGQRVVRELAARSDIVIASYKPGDAEKLGVDYHSLALNNPALIYGSISGYGSGNPRVGYDAIVQAEAGFMSMNGEPGGPSLKMPVALIDILAAHHLKEGILLAMLERTKSGKGKKIEVSLLQAAVSSLANQASNWLIAKKLPGKQGSAHPNIAPYGDVFLTSDGKEIIFAIGTDKQFTDLCSLLELHYLASDEKFITNEQRVHNRAELKSILATEICLRPSVELIPKLHSLKVPAGIIAPVNEVFHFPEVKEILLSGGGLQGVRTFVAGSETVSHIAPPPHLGEHSGQILTKRLGISPETVQNWLSSGIIS